MACFLYIAWSRDPQFCITHCAGVPLVIHHNSNGVDQIVSPKRSEFRKLNIKELHMTSLDGYLGVWKLTYTLFQRVWWPKLHE